MATVFLAILITLFGWWPLVGQSRLTRSNDLLTMLGVPPRQQYWRSYWLSFFAGTASTLSIGGLFLLASIPIHGVGSWNYPIMVWHSASERDFVPLLQLMSVELVIFLANWGVLFSGGPIIASVHSPAGPVGVSRSWRYFSGGQCAECLVVAAGLFADQRRGRPLRVLTDGCR